jgi:hypothetical protein
MTMFLDALIGEFHAVITRLERNATGDYSPDQHLHTLPEYRRKAALQSASPRSGTIAMQLFEKYILATKLVENTVKRADVACLSRYSMHTSLREILMLCPTTKPSNAWRRSLQRNATQSRRKGSFRLCTLITRVHASNST